MGDAADEDIERASSNASRDGLCPACGERLEDCDCYGSRFRHIFAPIVAKMLLDRIKEKEGVSDDRTE